MYAIRSYYEAYHEALEKGARTDAVLEMLKSARDAGLKVPVVLFSYLNPVYKRRNNFV